jgi:membrane-associated phospholipid phosphatase
MKYTLARLLSNIFNPFLVSGIILILLAFRATSGFAEGMKWVAITIVISILPLLGVVYFLVRTKRLDGFFNNPREQRNIIYLLGTVLGTIDCVFLWLTNAPDLLAISFTSAIFAAIVFMIINYFWKISLHTAFVAASAVVLIVIYGANAVWSLILLPLVGWSRLILKQHTLMQVIIGALLAVAIALSAFWGFGLVGRT